MLTPILGVRLGLCTHLLSSTMGISKNGVFSIFISPVIEGPRILKRVMNPPHTLLGPPIMDEMKNLGTVFLEIFVVPDNRRVQSFHGITLRMAVRISLPSIFLQFFFPSSLALCACMRTWCANRRPDSIISVRCVLLFSCKQNDPESQNARKNMDNGRLANNKNQPAGLPRFTEVGFKKITVPDDVWDLVKAYYEENK